MSRALRLAGFGLLVGVALLPLSSLSPALHALLEPWFELHCEREPARMLRLAGQALAVCARCSGVYFGLGLGALVRRPRLSPSALMTWTLLAAALMLTDVWLEASGAHGSWPAARVATGLLLAYPLGAGLGAALLRAETEALPAHKP